MKQDMRITFRSITFAQRGERLLQREGIYCQLLRTPKSLSQRGCGYSLKIGPKDALRAGELLRKNQVDFGKIYAFNEAGVPEEREI